MKCRFTPKTLTLLLATLWSASTLAQPTALPDLTATRQEEDPKVSNARPVQDSANDVHQLDSVEISGARSQDEIGYDNIYDKDISNTYVDRQYLERYRGVSTGDVFSGMNGVYNGDNRNGSALFPNIRGIAGNGRIPVTVDGTIQSIDVWMGINGINNRNYLDPNLFRSIEVEKGPSITRGIKSGIAGSVSIRTIDAGDIIQPGENWGFKISAGTANNSVRQSFDAKSIEGMDYRDIPGAEAVFLPLGTAPGLLFNQPLTSVRDGGSRFNGANRRIFMATGYQHERFDALAVYSNARRGNYFSGKKGASSYLDNGSQETTGKVTSARNMYPNMARIFEPGKEVPYTGTQTESFMLKNNWFLDNNQKISLSFTRNNLDFEEVPSIVSNQFIFNADNDEKIAKALSIIEYPFPASTVRQNVYRVGYEIKPDDSPWLDLEASLWHTTSHTSRYQNGDTTYQMQDRDRNWDTWVECNNAANTQDWPKCQGLIGAPAPEREPNTDNRYNILIANRLDSRAARSGFDISNRFRLNDKLSLTASADWQYERIKDIIPSAISVTGVGQSSSQFGPASGRREEYGTSLNLDFQATDRLNISVGARYGKYWSFDDETANQRAAGNRIWEKDRTNTHQKVEYGRLLTDEEVAMVDDLNAIYDQIDWDADDWEAAWEVAQQEVNAQMARIREYELASDLGENGVMFSNLDEETGLYYNIAKNMPLVPVLDGKADASQNPFYNGTLNIHETVTNPQGIEGTYKKYTPSIGSSTYFTGPAADDPWERPEKQRAGAWSTQLVASYRLTDRARTYVRYASMARFPSILESGNRAGRIGGEFLRSHNRPERNNAWEIGYTYNFSNLIPGLQQGDVKLNYYQNTIHDFFDRTNSLSMIQLDRKIMSGIELQSRFDTGRFHGGMGVSYRLRQEACDKNYSLMLDPHYFRIPECMDGGLPNTLSFLSLQPRYSLNLDLGARLLERKLDVGVRMRYHSRAANKSVDRMLAEHQSNGPQANGYFYGIPGFASGSFNRPYYWDSVTLVDLYAEYKMTDNAMVRLSVDNLTDRYYLDPLTRVVSPAPGRTVMLDMNISF